MSSGSRGIVGDIRNVARASFAIGEHERALAHLTEARNILAGLPDLGPALAEIDVEIALARLVRGQVSEEAAVEAMTHFEGLCDRTCTGRGARAAPPDYLRARLHAIEGRPDAAIGSISRALNAGMPISPFDPNMVALHDLDGYRVLFDRPAN